VPRSSQFKSLPKKEVEICRRVGSVRRYERVNQAQFAQNVGLTRNQLANIESGRVSLKFWTGWRICEKLDINQLWLSTGIGFNRPNFDINLSPFSQSLTEQTLFSEACEGVLSEELRVRQKAMEAIRDFPRTVDKVAQVYEDIIKSIIAWVQSDFPAPQRPAVIHSIAKHFAHAYGWGGKYDSEAIAAFLRTCMTQLSEPGMSGFFKGVFNDLLRLTPNRKHRKQPKIP
jgi:DNA-binding XRE family transcriptional regulator